MFIAVLARKKVSQCAGEDTLYIYTATVSFMFVQWQGAVYFIHLIRIKERLLGWGYLFHPNKLA